MTPDHEPWCTHHHHVEPTNDVETTEGGAEDWCCYRGPRDRTGRRVEISGHNRFLGVRIVDWVYPAEPMTEDDARELIAGIEGALDHVHVSAMERDLAGIADPAATQAALFEGQTSSAREWSQLGATTMIWIVVPLVVGLLMLRRSEVK